MAEDDDSSVESGFQFENYKLDRLTLKMRPFIGILGGVGLLNQEFIRMRVGVRKPQFHVGTALYIIGVDLQAWFYAPEQFSGETPGVEPPPEDAIVTIDAGAAGMFRSGAKRFSEDVENQLVRVQAPAILFPYLRAGVSTILAAAGFGAVPLPLINMHELARKIVGESPIEIMEP